MEMKDLYEALESLEGGGADYVSFVKEKLESIPILDKSAKAEKRRREALEVDFNTTKDMLEAYKKTGYDPEKISELAEKAGKADSGDDKLSTLTKRVETLTNQILEKEKLFKEKEEQDRQRKLTGVLSEKLTADFGGKMANIISKNYLSSGNLKLDEAGKPCIETEKGVFPLDEGCVFIREEYKENLIKNVGGSGQPPPNTGDSNPSGFKYNPDMRSDEIPM